jgi:hypothetical protein
MTPPGRGAKLVHPHRSDHPGVIALRNPFGRRTMDFQLSTWEEVLRLAPAI